MSYLDFYTAIFHGDTTKLKRLIADGLSLETPPGKYTLLHHAVMFGHTEAVGLFLDHKVDFNSHLGFQRRTPLLESVRRSNTAIFELLVSAGADVLREDDYRVGAILSALNGGQLHYIPRLQALGCDINASDEIDMTVLMRASFSDVRGATQFLIDHGAAVDLVDMDGWSALTWAIYNNDLESATHLLDAGAALDVIDLSGMTLLHIAIKRGHYDATCFLIGRGIDCNVKDNQGDTALLLMANQKIWSGDFIRDVALRLVDAGADPTLSNFSGESFESVCQDKDLVTLLACSRLKKTLLNDLLDDLVGESEDNLRL